MAHVSRRSSLDTHVIVVVAHLLLDDWSERKVARAGDQEAEALLRTSRFD
jgi:hypothetical protein